MMIYSKTYKISNLQLNTGQEASYTRVKMEHLTLILLSSHTIFKIVIKLI